MLIGMVLVLGMAPPADTKPVHEVIRALGAEEFEAREEATRRLLRRPDAAGALRAALLDADLEVRRRARRILDGLRAEQIGNLNRHAGRLLRDGRVDLATSLLTEEQGLDGKFDRWPDVARAVSHPYRALSNGGSPRPLGGDLDQWFKVLNPAARPILVSSSVNPIPKMLQCQVVFSNDLPRGTRTYCAAFSVTAGQALNFDHSLDFSAGGSARFSTMGGSVIVCGGDVTINELVNDSIIVARGRVQVLRGGIYRSFILTKETVKVGDLRGPAQESVIREHQRGLLGGIRFFELDEFGLIIAKGTDVARAVLPGVFRDAGLRPGDTILSVGGEKAIHAEQIRTLFMRHFLRPGPVYLKVTRGAETRTLYVNTPEPLKAPPP
jgi:hypothetical protein